MKAIPKTKPATKPATVPGKASKAKLEAAHRVTILAAVIARETNMVNSDKSARAAYIVSIAGRFNETTDAGRLTPDDLLAVYPDKSQAKTRNNRAGELNAAARTGDVLGASQAQRLLDACAVYGGRLREEWRSWSALARKAAREEVAAGTAKFPASVSAVAQCLAAMLAVQADNAIKEAAASASRDAGKAEKESEHAAAYVAKVSAKAAESGDASAVKPAEKAAEKAATKAAALRLVSDAASAKLPKAPAPLARTPAKIAQDVKVAFGSEELPLAALASMARDLCVRFRAGGDAKTADAIGKAVEKYAA